MRNVIQYPQKAEPILPEALRPEAVSIDRWLQPLSEPVRRSKGVLLAVALIASGVTYVGEPIVPPEPVTVDRWHIALSEPVHTKKPLPIGAYQHFATDAEALTQPEKVLLKWYQALSEPVRFKKPQTAQYKEFAADTVTPTPAEDVTVDRWLIALSEPVRAQKPLPIAAYPSFTVDTETPEPITVDRWHIQLSEPVRTKKPLPIATYKFFAQNELPIPPPPPAPRLEGWFRMLEEPPAFKVAARFIEALQVSFTRDPVTSKDQWGPERRVTGLWNPEAVPGGAGWNEENPPC